MTKIRRNAICPCGSGRKYKKCCGDPLKHERPLALNSAVPASIAAAFRQKAADERIRVKQQGLGRPIVADKVGDHRFVAVGDTLHWSPRWKTFPDFLSDYIKKTIGSDWGNAEIAKPLHERHPILQWYDGYCRLQTANQGKPGEVFDAEMTGVVHCYLGLAYNLYLLRHNAELQDRLVARLKDMRQFQGAYYELMVANCLIRAGFRLDLEDEADQTAKHCEFSATSEQTGARYWIEAKMRSIPGVLGKTAQDGSTNKDPTSRLSVHLSEALRKPAPDRRMIFIDLNAEVSVIDGKPHWLDQAVRRLEDRERDLNPGQGAYVFVTNMAFHRALELPTPGLEVLAHGLGISDFAKPGAVRLSDWYRRKQKHIDAFHIMEAFRTYPQIPETFDGRPASEAFSAAECHRIRVGETYFFEDVGDSGTVGTVGSVSVLDNTREAHVAITTTDSRGMVLTAKLSDAEYQDYRTYGDAYFGEPEQRNYQCKDISEFYEFLVRFHSRESKERLLERAKGHPDIERLRSLEQSDLVLELCESLVLASKTGRSYQNVHRG